MRSPIVLLWLSFAACSGAQDTVDAAVCMPATSAVAASGAEVVVLSMLPSPPARFENTWTVRATTATGAPASAGDVVASAFMPEHGHGTPTPPTVTIGSGDELVIGKLDLWMPGVWEIRFDIGVDRITFTTCVSE